MKRGTIDTVQMTGKNAQRIAPLDTPKPRWLVIRHGGKVKIKRGGGRETGHMTRMAFINAIKRNRLWLVRNEII